MFDVLNPFHFLVLWLFGASNLFYLLILQLSTSSNFFMDWTMGSHQVEFHTTRFNHMVVDDLESLILWKEVLQKVDIVPNED